MQIKAAFAKVDTGDRVKNADEAARCLRADFAGLAPAQVFYFAASAYDAPRLARAMRDAFPGAVTLGCTTSGEIANAVVHTGGVSALALGADVFERFTCRLLPRVGPDGAPADPRRAVEDAFAAFGGTFGRDPGAWDETRHVGLVLADGLRYFVEPVLDRVGDLTPVTFLGAIAGDDGQFRYTPVFLDGEAVEDAVLLALARPAADFGFGKTQGLELLDTVFTATCVDEPNRLVRELDGRPAAEAYAEAVGVPVDRMDLRGTFARWPFGLMVGDEPFLRVAVEALPDGSLRFWPAVKEGARLRLARPKDIVGSTEDLLADLREKLGPFKGMLHFNCMSRQHELTRNGELETFGGLFRDYPNAGFSSHGEIFVAVANQTSTILAFS